LVCRRRIGWIGTPRTCPPITPAPGKAEKIMLAH